MNSKLFFLVFLSSIVCNFRFCDGIPKQKIKNFFDRSNHTDIWALLVDTHPPQYYERSGSGATRTFYQLLKKFGVSDDKIILMTANQETCYPTNPTPGQVFSKYGNEFIDVNEGVEVDYRFDEVNVQNVLRILTGRHPPGTPKSKRLRSDRHSNVIVFFAGHGGKNGATSFRDQESMDPRNLARAVQEMQDQGRFNAMLVVFATCYAGAACRKFTSKNLICLGTSPPTKMTQGTGGWVESETAAYSQGYYEFVSYFSKLLEEDRKAKYAKHSFDYFLSTCTSRTCGEDSFSRRDLYPKDLKHVPLVNFFKPQSAIEYLTAMEIGEHVDESGLVLYKRKKKSSQGFDNQ